MTIFDAAGMREADRRAIEAGGLPGIVLMETAGRMAAEHLLRALPQAAQGALILCGRGNNGGDGFVLARYLLGKGFPHHVIQLFGGGSTTGDAALHREIALKAGVEWTEVLDVAGLDSVFSGPRARWVRVDAVLGTGIRSEVRGLYKNAIDRLYDGGAAAFALDLPSGVHPNTGALLGVEPRAQATATFGGLKLGLAMEPGASAAGDVEVMDIGLMPRLIDDLPIGRLLSHGIIEDLLPRRGVGAHKGSFGHLLIVAGSAGKAGAAALCARAALRSGAGLVTLGIPKGALANAIPMPPEAMIEALPDTPSGALSSDAIPQLLALAEGKSALAIGPGIGTGKGAGACLRALLGLEMPTLLDADALNLIAKGEGLSSLDLPGAELLLTPHPGELGRLLRVTSKAVQGDRLRYARAGAANSGSIVLLKGARTLIAQAGGFVDVNPTGNPGMATGGTGDVLTGLAGGLMAQGLPPRDAACAGAYIHGLAGDLLKAKAGERAMVAGDLIEGLFAAFIDVMGEGA